MTTALLERFHALPAAAPAEALHLDSGTIRDYLALAAHHYRAGRPATATRVLVLRDDRPTAVDRYLARPADAPPVAVLVESLPTLSCRLRDAALRDRFGPWLEPRARAALLNEEVRCISRVVVDPRWRGTGLAVRLVRHALATATTRYTEALAAMGHVSPFFERAGMTAYRRPAHAFDARLAAALRVVGLDAADLVLAARAWRRIDALPDADRRWLLVELDRWHRQTLGRSRHRTTDPREQLRAARRRLLAQPVYYLHARASPV